MRTNKPWPTEQTARLVELVEAGTMSYGDIAIVMGMNKNMVIGKAKRLGLSNVRSTGKRDEGSPTIETRLAALDIFPGYGRCVFPLGDPGNAEFRFCGEGAGEGAYCGQHWSATHVRGSADGPR